MGFPKLYHLPQVNAPYIYVLGKLKDEGIKFKKGSIDPNKLSPMQGLVSLEKISDISSDEIKPIWTSQEDKVLDGHHRLGSAIVNGRDIGYFKIMLPALDAARVLNKIQDIYEYETQQKMEEVVAQDQINNLNEPATQDFLSMIGDEANEAKEILHSGSEEKVGRKKRKLFAYRKDPLNEKSTVGNFFSVKPVDGYTKYEIEFDNLLDTDKLGIGPFNGNPIETLAKIWFPHVDFKSIGTKYNKKSEHIINRAVAEMAKKMGYDGIKYGDIIIQGLK